jgi:hypothetical protein
MFPLGSKGELVAHDPLRVRRRPQSANGLGPGYTGISAFYAAPFLIMLPSGTTRRGVDTHY